MNTYMKPTMMVVKIQHSCHILNGSPVTSVGGNVFDSISSDEGYSGGVRTKESSSIWDDEW